MKIERNVSLGSIPVEVVQDDSPVEFLHSGSICLNLAGSNKGRNGGWARGRIINLVGDGSSGKTLLALELAAYCFHKMLGSISANFPTVKRVKIVFDNGEGVMDFPVAAMYGQDFYDAVFSEENRVSSQTVQEFGRRFGREMAANKPGEMLLYIVDSLDSLAAKEGLDRFEKAIRTDKEEDGTYGTEKAKYLSQSFFDNVCHLMKGKDITLVIISQIREKIGISFGKKHGRTGGKALDFYTHQVCWLYEMEKMKRTLRGEERAIGIRVLAKFERNKVAKPFRDAEIQILFDYGLDDLSSSLAWLYGPKVKVLSFHGVEFSRAELIKHIESNGLEDKLAELVEEKWQKIEDELRPDRKEKF